MGLKKSTEKLDKYYSRLGRNEVGRIKPDHVAKVLSRLQAKEAELLAEVETATKIDKRDRSAAKLAVVRQQIERAKWLLAEISNTG